MRRLSPYRVAAATGVLGLLAGCTGIIAVERPGCTSERSVEVIRENGKPSRTTIRAWRFCGEPNHALKPQVAPDARATDTERRDAA